MSRGRRNQHFIGSFVFLRLDLRFFLLLLFVGDQPFITLSLELCQSGDWIVLGDISPHGCIMLSAIGLTVAFRSHFHAIIEQKCEDSKQQGARTESPRQRILADILDVVA